MDQKTPTTQDEARRRAEAEKRQGMQPSPTNGWNSNVANTYNNTHNGGK